MHNWERKAVILPFKKKISSGGYFETYTSRELCDFHMPSSFVLALLFRLHWDLNEMSDCFLCPVLSWHFFPPPATSVPVWIDDIDEEMPLQSHTQGFTAQVNRAGCFVPGMATTFLIISFILPTIFIWTVASEDTVLCWIVRWGYSLCWCPLSPDCLITF